MLSRILVPLDGSELGDRIVSILDRLPRPQEVELILVRVLESPGQDAQGAHEHLLGVADRLQESGVQATPLVTIGDPAARILQLVGLLVPSLVAMSTRGEGDARGWGSVAFRVLERCPVPLLTGNPRSLPLDPGAGFARILVPLDGTQTSASVLPTVVAIARHHQAEVLLLLVDPRAESAEEVGAEELARERAQVEQAGVGCRVLTRVGDEAAQILAAAEEQAVDLLAMTSHARPDPGRNYFGSVAEQVVKACSCPLLLRRIVPPAAG